MNLAQQQFMGEKVKLLSFKKVVQENESGSVYITSLLQIWIDTLRLLGLYHNILREANVA